MCHIYIFIIWQWPNDEKYLKTHLCMYLTGVLSLFVLSSWELLLHILLPVLFCVCLMSPAGRFWGWKCVLGMLSC